MATFKETFAAKRKELGAGKTFTWNGKSYTTDMASDKKSTPTAANKPKARPAMAKAKSNAAVRPEGKPSAMPKAMSMMDKAKADVKARRAKAAKQGR